MTKRFSTLALINMWHTAALVPYAIITSLSLWSDAATNGAITSGMLITRHATAALFLLILYVVFRNIAKIKTPVYPVAIVLHAVTIYLTILSWNPAVIIAAVSMLLSTLLIIAYKKNYTPNDKPRGNDWNAWFANREFRRIAVILAVIYGILFIVTVIKYETADDDIWRRYATLFASIIYTAFVIEFFRALYVARGSYKKDWIAIVDNKCKVIGGVNTVNTHPDTNNYILVEVRIIVLNGGKIYLRRVKHISGYNTLETPFTAILRYREQYKECLLRATKGVINVRSLHFVTKYKYSCVNENRIVFMYICDLQGKDLSYFEDTGRFWSKDEISKAKPGEISEVVRAEFDFLDGVIFDAVNNRQ